VFYDLNLLTNTYITGLFKVEWSGDGFIGLNAKTYCCFNNEDDTNTKISSKGVNKSFGLSKEHFKSVLFDKNIPTQQNKGFIFKNNKMLTYSMDKEGLKHVYTKRKLLADGVSTTYLDI